MTTKVDNILNAYANDFEGLTHRECLDADFPAKQCDVLRTALGKGAKGIITPEEKTELEQAGFAKDFIQDLAGIDGKKALQSRVRWLGEYIKGDNYNQTWVANELSNIGPDAKESIPSLIDALKSKRTGVRSSASSALGNIGKEAIPALIDVFKNETGEVRASAAWALADIGPDAKEIIPTLIDALKDEYRYERTLVIYILTKIGKDAVPALIDVFKNAGEDLRFSIIQALGDIGPKAKEAIPILIEVLKYQIGREAEETLARIGTEAVPALIDALKDKDKNRRIGAAETLKKIGKQAFFAIPVLQKMVIEDPDPDCRRAAQWALDKMMGEIR